MVVVRLATWVHIIRSQQKALLKAIIFILKMILLVALVMFPLLVELLAGMCSEQARVRITHSRVRKPW